MEGEREPDRSELLQALADLFGLLSEVFLEPEADVKVRLGQMRGRCPARCPGLEGLPSALESMRASCDAPQVLAVEYVRLFLHGNTHPTVHLYESVYTYGRLMAPECLDDLRAIYDAADLHVSPKLAIPPDHLGLELEFLGHLVGNLAESPEGGPEAARWRALADQHLRRHLVPFARLFTGRLEGANPHPYFRHASQTLVESLHACALLLGAGPR